MSGALSSSSSSSRVLDGMQPESMEETLLSGESMGVGTRGGGDLHRSEDLQLTRVEHYVLLHRVGRGAMGAVYAAYDETLDRKVAIKLLHAEGEGQVRLLREAQALARLSHPNVVQVYEVGAFGEVPFIAMEFVEGLTLREWRKREEPGQERVLEVFRAAGRGLVAAHDKGLVHRDFKPDNVMVADDGRVLVMDFGLARGEASPLAEELVSISSIERSADLLPAELTRTGTVMGTPAYMAPEQFGGVGGSASDQFSFCVALWEALCGSRPFQGENLYALELAIREGKLRPAPQLPTWLRRVLERGLSPDPEARWASMEALLDALADDPTRRRRTLVGSVVAVVGLLSLVIGAALYSEHREAQREADELAQIHAHCSERGGALARGWPEARTQLGERFGVHVGGRELWTRTAQRLDAYVAQWGSERERSCLAAAGRAPQPLSTEFAQRERSCLEDRRVTFEALLEVWAEVDEGELQRAPGAAAELPLISTCASPNFLAHQVPAPEDAATRAQVGALRAQLERAAAQQLAAEYDAALAEVEQVLAGAETLAWAPLVAEARFAKGDLLERLGDFEGSQAELQGAFFAAGDAGHDFVALQAASKLTWTVGVRLFDYERGLLWAEIGEMFVRRLGLERSLFEAKRLNARAALEFRRNHGDEALAAYRRALELRESELGQDHPQVAATLNNIGLVHSSRGEYEQALVALRRSLELRTASHGPHHPDVAGSHNNLSIVFYRQGDNEQASDHAKQGLELLERALSPTHPEVGSAHSNLGVIESARGNYQAALESHARGLEIKRANLGKDHALVSVSLAFMGEAHYDLGNFEAARELLEEALLCAQEGKRLPNQRATNLFALAEALDVLEEQPKRAHRLAEEAAELLREAGEAHVKELAEVEAWLAREDR